MKSLMNYSILEISLAKSIHDILLYITYYILSKELLIIIFIIDLDF